MSMLSQGDFSDAKYSATAIIIPKELFMFPLKLVEF